LVEVLVALALLAIVLLPVVMGLSQALTSTSESTISAAAASIARDKVEELKGMSFADLASQPRQSRDLKVGDAFFEVAVVATTVRADNDLHVGLKNAVVSVYRTGGARPVAVLSTYLVPYGV
jgi:Tfp pilus assembly protein PilV